MKNREIVRRRERHETTLARRLARILNEAGLRTVILKSPDDYQRGVIVFEGEGKQGYALRLERGVRIECGGF